jgi:hypothetical protein
VCGGSVSNCAATTAAQQETEEPAATDPTIAPTAGEGEGTEGGSETTKNETNEPAGTETTSEGNTGGISTLSVTNENEGISPYSETTTKEVKYLDASGTEHTVQATAISIPSSKDNIIFDTDDTDGWFYVEGDGDISLYNTWQVDTNINIILLDGQKLRFWNGTSIDLYRERGGSITFYSQSRGDNEGYIHATSSDNPGIGHNATCGNITFNGGSYYLAESDSAPALGSPDANITINAGTFRFASGTGAYNNISLSTGDNGSLTINDGSLTFNSHNNTQISTGTLVVAGGMVDCSDSQGYTNIYAAQSITISGGTVYAKGNPGIKTAGTFSTTSSGTAHITASSIIDKNGSVSDGTITGLSCIYTEIGEADGAEDLNTTVYGNQTLSTDTTIAKNETFTVPKGSSLAIPQGTQLANKGILVIKGTATAEKAESVSVSSTATMSGSITTTSENIPILIPRITAQDKTYNGSSSANATWEFVGLPEGETLTAGDDYDANASFEDANAGENKVVEGTLAPSNSLTSKYALSAKTATTTATINKAPLTPSITAEDKTYNKSFSATISASFEGFVNNETFTTSDYSVSGRFADANAGENKVVEATIFLNNTATANNYTLTTSSATTTASIARASQSIPDADSCTLNFAEETITFDDALYEVNTDETFYGNFIGNGASITPDTNLYLRAKESENYEASQPLQISLGMRPAAPANISAVAEVNKGANDGKITGLTTSMEYKLENATEWTTASGESVSNLAPGTYFVRYQATSSTFASEAISVEIDPSYTSTEAKEDGTVVETTYNEKDEVTKVVETDTAGNTTTTKYNEDGTKVEIKRDSEGNITQERTYAANGSYVQTGFTPEIIEGANAVFTHAEDALTFRSNDEFINFLKVKVDGAEIDPANYTAVSGSIKVSLKKAYLETLSAGTHTMEIVSTNGSTGTSFTVQAKQETTPSNGTTNPSTGSDNDSTSNDNTTNNGSNDTSSTDESSDNSSSTDTSSSSSNSKGSSSTSATSLSATGDTLPLALCLALLCVATASLIVLIRRQRNRLQ